MAGLHSFPEALGKNTFLWFFHLLKATHILLLMGSFIHLQSQLHRVESSHHLTQSFCLPIASTFKDPCDYFGPTQMFQEIFHILRSSFHLMLAEIITATTLLFLIYFFTWFQKMPHSLAFPPTSYLLPHSPLYHHALYLPLPLSSVFHAVKWVAS